MDPRTEDSGVTRFIFAEIEGCFCVPSPFVPPWKNSSCVFSKVKTRASVKMFYLIVPALAVLFPIQVA